MRGEGKVPNRGSIESVTIWSILSLIFLSLIIAAVYELSFENEIIAVASVVSYGFIPYIATKAKREQNKPYITFVTKALGNFLFIIWLLYIFVVPIQMMFYVFMTFLLSFALTDLLFSKQRNFEWFGVISILVWLNFMR